MPTYAPMGFAPAPAIIKIPSLTMQSTLAPMKGGGYLAGSYPGGVTTVDGVPVGATVRAMYRPASGALGDGVCVAEVQSAADGTWIIPDLNPSLKFDVVGRKAGFNDVIMANVSPKVV